MDFPGSAREFAAFLARRKMRYKKRQGVKYGIRFNRLSRLAGESRMSCPL